MSITRTPAAIVWIASIVVALFIGVGIGAAIKSTPASSVSHAGAQSPAAAAATTTPAGSSSQSQSSQDLSGPVGTTYTVTETNNSGNTVSYQVTLDQFIQNAQPDNSFDTAPSGDHLAAAKFTIQGVTGADSDDSNNDATAIGNDQQTYSPGFEGIAASTNFDHGAFNTSPGSNSVGWVTLEVKNGVTVTGVQWSPSSGMSGGSPATWTIA